MENRAVVTRPRLMIIVAAIASIVAAALLSWAIVRTGLPALPAPPMLGDPPVLAGRHLWGFCSAGFYARRGDEIVLTSSGHCAAPGTMAVADDGTVLGVFGEQAFIEPCRQTAKVCMASDMNLLVVAPDQVPWGRLNVVDLGHGGHRTIAEGIRPLACGDIAIGDRVEIDGRDVYRSGTVAEIGPYPQDPAANDAFVPCMVASADIRVATGDSGGAVLVNGLPAGVTSRSFGGVLGFTPLAEGLTALGLELCTTPDCGLSRGAPVP